MLLQTLLLCVVKKYICFKRRINLLALVSEFCRTKGFVKVKGNIRFQSLVASAASWKAPSLAGGPFSPRDTAAPSGTDRTAPGTARWAQMTRARRRLPLTRLPVLFFLLPLHRSGARCRRATPTRRPRCGAHCPQDFGSREEPGEEPGLRQRAHL